MMTTTIRATLIALILISFCNEALAQESQPIVIRSAGSYTFKPDPDIAAMTEYELAHQTWPQKHPKIVKWSNRVGKAFFVAIQITGSVMNIVRP